MYSCRPPHEMPKSRGGICGGHGNRLEQIAQTLRVAAGSGRILLIDWSSPEILEDHLHPAEIEWIPTSAERSELVLAPVYHGAWPNKTLAPPPESSKYVRVTGGDRPLNRPCFGCAALRGMSFATAWQVWCAYSLREGERHR